MGTGDEPTCPYCGEWKVNAFGHPRECACDRSEKSERLVPRATESQRIQRGFEPRCSMPPKDPVPESFTSLGMRASYSDMLEFLEGYIGHDAFTDLLANTIRELKEKNADYSGTKDPIANFRNLSEDLGIPMRQIWLVYFVKGIDAIKRYCKDGQLSSEKLQSRVGDAINYLLILDAIMKDGLKER